MPDQVEHLDRLATALAGRYRIKRELGRGGMATVFLAKDLKHDRHVAVKVLLPELAAVLGPERFLREIKVTARLNHPHILPLLDSGEADHFLYYVMPYVEDEVIQEVNYLLNPVHPDFGMLDIGPAEPFVFDERLLQP